MKLKIKYKLLAPEYCRPFTHDDGEWIDLSSARTVGLKVPIVAIARKTSNRIVTYTNKMVPLGVAIKLPKGYEAVVNPRSSMFKRYGCILANSQGVIDNSYCGNGDQWFANIVCLRRGEKDEINEGERIVQFRVQLSQNATVWQKIKNLFYSGTKLVEVPSLSSKNRGGFGSTGL